MGMEPNEMQALRVAADESKDHGLGDSAIKPSDWDGTGACIAGAKGLTMFSAAVAHPPLSFNLTADRPRRLAGKKEERIVGWHPSCSWKLVVPCPVAFPTARKGGQTPCRGSGWS
jgi:hypothetical protein